MNFNEIVGNYDTFLREYKQTIFTKSFYYKRLYNMLLGLYQQLDEDEIRKVIEFGISENFSFNTFWLSNTFVKILDLQGVIIMLVKINDLGVLNLGIDIEDLGENFGNNKYIFRIRLYRHVKDNDEENLEIIKKLKNGDYVSLVSEKSWQHISTYGILDDITIN